MTENHKPEPTIEIPAYLADLTVAKLLANRLLNAERYLKLVTNGVYDTHFEPGIVKALLELYKQELDEYRQLDPATVTKEEIMAISNRYDQARNHLNPSNPPAEM